MSVDLVEKYGRPVPRYTSYPTVPMWNGAPDFSHWLDSVGKNGEVDLYIHIPYCVSLCYYCGCNKKITKNRSKGTEYTEYLIKEWHLYKDLYPDLKIRSIHFGGGTPNFLLANDIEKLLRELKENVCQDFLGSIEVDPRTISIDQMRVFSKYGFKRVSMGIQDFNLNVQTKINRIQSFDLVKEVTNEFRLAGFTSVNFDLIYGLPGQSLNSIKDTFEKSMNLKPEMIAYYSYAHLPKKFAAQRLFKSEDLPNQSLKAELFSLGKELLRDAGYFDIGLDHFAKNDSYLVQAFKTGKLVRSFMGYTDRKAPTTLGLGVSSISQNEEYFVQNTNDIAEYEHQINTGEIQFIKGHIMQGEDSFREKLIQELMCLRFIDKEKLSFLEHKKEINLALKDMQKDKIIQEYDTKWQITDVGMPYLRIIAALFDEYLGHESKKGVQFSNSI